jgi:hypothetical protein
MTATETPTFVVVLTHEGQFTPPRAVGPFDDYDVAQSFAQTLVDKWEVQQDDPPQATVVRVEDAYPGVVVGEI